MSEATIKELEQLQNEKRKMLMEHETEKLKQREEAFSKELREWKAQLKPRKQVSRGFVLFCFLCFFNKITLRFGFSFIGDIIYCTVFALTNVSITNNIFILWHGFDNS